TPEGIGEATVGSGMAGIQFMLAVQMELMKECEEASRAWMSEVKLWSKLAVKLSTSASVLIAARCLRWQRAWLLPLAQSRQATGRPRFTSGAPKIFKSLLAEFGVASGVLNGAMTEPILNCPRVVALIGQRVAASVAQHVDVNLEWEARSLTD